VLANALARRNEVEYDRGGLEFKVHVPDEVDFKLEIEVEEHEWELEVELTWGRARRGRAKRPGGAKRRGGAKRS
jgi:amphi-Trp domain-containing protein